MLAKNTKELEGLMSEARGQFGRGYTFALMALCFELEGMRLEATALRSNDDVVKLLSLLLEI